jgi:hypothetical protein
MPPNQRVPRETRLWLDDEERADRYRFQAGVLETLAQEKWAFIRKISRLAGGLAHAEKLVERRTLNVLPGYKDMEKVTKQREIFKAIERELRRKTKAAPSAR